MPLRTRGPYGLAALVTTSLACASSNPAPVSNPAPAEADPPPAVAEPPPPKVAVSPEDPVESEPAPRTEPAEPFVPLKLSAVQRERALKVQPLVAGAAAEHGVDPNVLNAIIWRESKFNPKARNPSGARGLMQLMPVTGKAMAKKLGRSFRPYDAEFSIQAGAKLLSILLGRFDDNLELALFGYARGSGSVRKWQREGGPKPERVVAFVAKVEHARRSFELMGFPTPGTSPQAAVQTRGSSQGTASGAITSRSLPDSFARYRAESADL